MNKRQAKKKRRKQEDKDFLLELKLARLKLDVTIKRMIETFTKEATP